MLFQLTIAVLILTLVTVFTSVSPSIFRTTSDDLLKDQTMLIDEGLSLWYAHHSGQYPENIAILQSLDFISRDIDITKFIYALNSNNTQYKLTVKLKTGETYKSLGSRF
jgi:hypothetical protein